MIVFRPATVDDVPAMTALMQRAFDPRFGEAWSGTQLYGTLALPGAAAEVAVADGRLCGFTLVRRAADEVELLLIAVDPAERRRGVGRQLLDRAIGSSRCGGLRNIHLEVRACNAAATGLYLRAGFIAIGRRAAYYHGSNSERFDAITMSLAL
jgi:ribosomal-protein-alanine N-acetyltransferase